MIKRIITLSLSAALFVGASVNSAPSADPLAAGFAAPPMAARPRVWWHWMDGNVTHEGIRLDLEWMQRVGIGGLQTFDAALSTPQRVSQRLVYMTPEWKRAFAFTAETAAKLGLELSIAGSPGWSESGGPWVKPEEAMKKLVWSETRVDGGKPFTGKLSRPPSTVGPFQNMPIEREGAPRDPVREVYEDIAVMAYPLPETERSLAELNASATSSAGPIEGPMLWDGDLAHTLSIPFGASGERPWVQVAFPEPQTMRAVSFAMPSAKGFISLEPTRLGELQSSAEGRQFSKVLDIIVEMKSDPVQTLTFAPVRARYFRLVLDTIPTLPGLEASAKKKEHRLAELVLHTSARVHRAPNKAAFYVQPILENASTPAAPTETLIRKERIVDLTERLRADGSLDWTPPAGRWAVLRFGYSLLGITNHPASPEATGLEVDKLNRAHVRSNYTQYLDRFASTVGPALMGQQGLRGMVSDSWEAGAQNWTEELPAEFAKRRGYEVHAWLPALTGAVIESSEATERFLWDFRRTLAELVEENHYAVIAEELHKRGMIHYAEAHEYARAFLGDGMAAKRYADVPMGHLWTPGAPFIRPETCDVDIRESASVAHFYGQNIAAAESFSAFGEAYTFTPEKLKATADRALANGLNRFVIHTSVHQPLSEPGPGFTLGPFGQWFTRHETWASQAGAWVSYLTRSSYLLQQGRFVADVLYFYGEDSNITALYGKTPPLIPEGFNYDFANPDVLEALSVENSQLLAPSGMRYRVLVLDPRTRVMSLPLLKRIQKLVAAGAIVIGGKPEVTPSLADDTAAFTAISDAVWNTKNAPGEPSIGKETVINHPVLSEALARLGIDPDFSYVKPAPDTNILFVHRRLSDGDLYFINNRQSRMEQIEASFRVTGKAPQLWHADTGRIEPAPYRFVNGRTIVPLTLAPADAVFVVFREAATKSERTVPAPRRTTLSALNGPWEVRFSTDQGAPAVTRFEKMHSWTESADSSIKYYSGTAAYTRSIHVPASWMTSGAGIELDLGAVKDLADVRVNGQSLGVLWKPPFRVDVTSALRPGANRLEVRITNTWVNRLIGDKQSGMKPYAYATFDPYKADSPLLPSGLLGPVTLRKVSNQ